MTALEALSVPLEIAWEDLVAGRASLHAALEHVKHAVLDYEDSEGIKRIMLPPGDFYQTLITDARREAAQKTAGKAIFQKSKRKLINTLVMKEPVSHVEALRLLMQYEITALHRKRKLSYQTDFKAASRLFFPFRYTQGSYTGELAKLDIHACFYTIYSRLGLDAQTTADIDHDNRIIRVKAVGRGCIRYETSPIIRHLQHHKQLRNALYGLTRAAWCLWYRPTKPTVTRSYFRGALQNLDLTVVISATLHALVEPFWTDIIYWNIDGGVLSLDAAERMANYLNTLGFAVTLTPVREFHVKALGAYQLDGKKTGHYDRVRQQTYPCRDYLYKVEGAEKIFDWLRRCS